MGGIGKTKLIQAVWNDDNVAKMFDIRAWVSKDFDAPRIPKPILKDITFSACDSLDFNQVLGQLQDHAAGEGRQINMISLMK